MILRVLVTVCWLARFAPAQDLACHPVEGDRILGKHLAGALTAFQAIPPGTFLSNMPPFGSKRIFHAPELTSLAQRYSIPLSPDSASLTDICFEWPAVSLESGDVMQAMRESLQSPGAQIEITETSLAKVPRGRLEFPLEMLGRPASPSQKDPVLWRGQVVYGDDRRFTVWAKVRIRVACQRTVAAESLKIGQPIGQLQFRVEAGECFPARESLGQAPGSPETPRSPLGMVAKRAIAAGTEIRPDSVGPPNDVNRGDAVHVEVRSGAAHLAFTAKAESGGHNGDFIAVRNPSTNKIFRARIKGKDQVLVQTEFAGSTQ
jgi:flagella basal body P-ring formation protein FlgA